MATRLNLHKNFVVFHELNLFSRLGKCYSTAPKPVHADVSGGKLEAMSKSLASRGFLRSNKPYAAPLNAAQKVHTICASLQIPSTGEHVLSNLEEKFKLLDACFKDFDHNVPNSQVHELRTVGDVMKFYSNSVDTTVPYDALRKMDLPENLHIQYDYLRFHPDTDTKFNGKTAFPKSSTLVTGLKYRGKYAGHEAKMSWP